MPLTRINSTSIDDQSITATKIADSAITTPKLNSGLSLGNSHLSAEMNRLHDTIQIDPAAPANSLQIDPSGYMLTPNRPAFYVRGLTSHLYANDSSAVDNVVTVRNWRDVKMNVGNHWDNSNGTFTSPKSGTYIIHFDPMYKHVSGDIHFRINVNGNVVILNNPHSPTSPWHNAPLTWVGLLTQNDVVTFSFNSSGASDTYMYGTSNYCACWGYLLG